MNHYKSKPYLRSLISLVLGECYILRVKNHKKSNFQLFELSSHRNLSFFSEQMKFRINYQMKTYFGEFIFSNVCKMVLMQNTQSDFPPLLHTKGPYLLIP